ncbi:hypothetical protein BPAE_0017g00820 [Botrytis paeoniae]|uniref:Cyanovirin-N domain-containing protein n=1 Tax=Botrytis paeoniae TaxID=278948 RepID=A0A4Z1FWR6_9HELO|nr:hypothetical protein BPAE_0017g00820 [Botrytis paeoniae]
MRFSALRTALCFNFLGMSLGIGVRYCNGLDMAGICFDVDLAAGACRNVDLSVNDQTHSATISGGNCVFWENANCGGDHTNQLDGRTMDFNNVCGGGWQKRISSFKCCDGNVANTWCAGSRPSCT